MLTQEALKNVAVRLPQPYRDRYFEGRRRIRDALRNQHAVVFWDDPEFIARCAVLLATLETEVNNEISRRFGAGD